MTPRTGHVVVACLVAMVAAAAPPVDRTKTQEEAVSLSGDSDSASLDRGKRAKEEIVFGNQQNGAKLPAPAAKKSAPEFHFPPLMPSGLMAGPPAAEGPGRFGPFPPEPLEDRVDQTPFQFFGAPAAKPGYQVLPSQQGQEAKGRLQDKGGFMYASEQRPVEVGMEVGVDPIREETLSELPAPDTPAPSEKEGEKEKESPEPKSPAQPAAEEPTPESIIGELEEPSPQKSPDAEESEKGEEGLWENSEALMKLENAAGALPSPPSSSLPELVESVVPVSQGSGPPLDSRLADAEEALHAKDQAMETNDVEDFLQDLQESKQVDNQAENQRLGEGEEKENEEEEIEEAQEKAKEEEEKEEEKEEKDGAEAELMQMMSPDAEEAEKSLESGDYTKQLLKYILMNSHDYGRAPVGVPGYPGYPSYLAQRRRRSLDPHQRLPHIHRRRRSGGKQLSRSKRTKRDLFDDDLYLNPNSEYAFQQAVREEEKAEREEEEEEEEERQAEMEELISYLMALYPAVYQNQPPPRGSPYPGYMWYGNNYPEEAYPEEEEEVSEYLQPPFAEWEPPSQPAPAWEPAFYPEEVDQQGYYPAPAKRQSLGRGYPTRDLYPQSQEPSWGAFMPSQEDRAYAEAYQRLQDLASVLAEAGQSAPYDFNAYSDYRKK